MRFFYDTEFIEDGHTIGLISIGIVAANGAEYYAVNGAMNQSAIVQDDWLRNNVWPSLPRVPLSAGMDRVLHPEAGVLNQANPCVKHPKVIAAEVAAFLKRPGAPIELWADYAAYDHVALCQMFGRMIDLPRAFPMFTNDIQQLAGGITGLPRQESGLHNALDDARHCRRLHEFLTN